MAYVAHQAIMATVEKDGSTVRDSYVVKVERACRGKGKHSQSCADAVRELEGPPGPGALAYLFEWFNELFGRSGANEHGLAPLSFVTLDAWARLTRRKPKPHEVDALMQLDFVKRNPASMQTTDEDADG